MKIIVITLTSLLLAFASQAGSIVVKYKDFPQGEFLMSAQATSNLVDAASGAMISSNAATNTRLDSYTNAITQNSVFAQASLSKTSGWDQAAAFVGQPAFSQLTNSWISAADQAASMVLKTQFWGLAWSFVFSATPKTNEWNQAYAFYADNASKVAQWDSAYLVSLYAASRTNAWDSAATFASVYASHTSGWDWAASLVQPFNFVSNLAVNAATKIELEELTTLVNAKPDVSYVDSKDALDRAYAYALFQSATSTNGGGIAASSLFDRYAPANSWLEYGSGTVWRVTAVSATNTYQWFLTTTADISVTASTFYNAQRHPESGVVMLGAWTTNLLIGATNLSLMQEVDVFYPSTNITNGASVLGIVATPAGVGVPYVFPAFARDNPATTDVHYSGPGINPSPYGESSDLSAFLLGSAAAASGTEPPESITNFMFHTQTSYYNDGGPHNTYTIGENGAVMTVFRVTTPAAPVTNRVDLLADTNLLWQAIEERVPWADFNSATQALHAAQIVAALGGTNFTVAAAQAGSNNVAAASLAGTNYTASLFARAWTNPPYASDFTWESDGTNVTITGYTGPGGDVVIPEMIDGKPVVVIGDGNYAVLFPGATSVTGRSIRRLELGGVYGSDVTNAVFPNLEYAGMYALRSCPYLVSADLGRVSGLGFLALSNDPMLSRVIFRGDSAPSVDDGIYTDTTAGLVTNYVTNPTATGWGATFGGMPVVRMPIEAERVNAGTVISITSTTTGTNTAGYFAGNGAGITNVNAALLGGYSSSEYLLNSWFTNWVSTNSFGVSVSASGGLTTITNGNTVTVDGSGKLGTNLLVTSGAVTNQIIVSPVGTNNVATVWKGTYAEYVALTDKTNTTTYIITDDLQYDTKGIYSEVYDYESVYPTTTVTVAQEKAVYTILMTTNCTITVDTNNVNLVGKVADFTLALVFTNWNVLSPTFCSCFDWGGYTPEFTVTGRYEFACTMIGDGRIRIKQTYPTVYIPSIILAQTPSQYNFFSGSSWFTDGGTLTNNCFFVKPSVNSYDFYSIELYGNGLTNSLTAQHLLSAVQIDIGYGSSVRIPSYFSTAFQKRMCILLGSGPASTCGFSQFINYDYTFQTGIRLIRSSSAGSIIFLRATHRKMNELEIKAYDAGWRP